MYAVTLLILDQQWTQDRKVIVMHESTAAWFTQDGEWAWPESTDETKDLVRRNVWKKYRVPFEEAFTVQCAVQGFCGLESADPCFEKEVIGDVVPKEKEEDGDEDEESDETTSEDLVYMSKEELRRIGRKNN
ncbi:hypothetical protein EK21DRAFT_113813 [Setomelanomma holmii]|uniref:Uncharacterized protein n=1 Tax=Setomelanomma holmii TaxID=210430 RepID=A0A9P4H7F5_9PLEO|nr:hypothetical protein EK21DRAFT_113813 [Setomelanomma holmii]